MTWKRCKALIASDLWRHTGKLGAGTFWSCFFRTPGFRYAALWRFCVYSRAAPWCQLGVRRLTVLVLRHYTFRFGIDISRYARIGSGLYIAHFGGIFVSGDAVIGDNCSLTHGVTLGQQNRGERAGCPVIGNNVYIGPGAKIIGRVNIGNYALVGPNSVVVNDVAPHTVVGGIPARPISDQGSDGYVDRTDYPPVPAE
jgi:serine O-acetyltransferase